MTQYLYIIKCQEYFKIGVANDVESRLAQLSTGNPFPLEVQVIYEFENAESIEKALHQRYKENRVRGEWFRLGYEDLKNIHSVCFALGGSAFEYTGQDATEEVIEEAEEIQENSFFEYNPETMRTEARMQNGEFRGIVVILRGKEKTMVAYFGKNHTEFRKYLEIYKTEHPESRVHGQL